MPFVCRLTREEIQALPGLLSTRKGADLLGMHMRAVQKMAKEGRLPAVMFGNRWYLNTAKLLEQLGLNDKDGERL